MSTAGSDLTERAYSAPNRSAKTLLRRATVGLPATEEGGWADGAKESVCEKDQGDPSPQVRGGSRQPQDRPGPLHLGLHRLGHRGPLPGDGAHLAAPTRALSGCA